MPWFRHKELVEVSPSEEKIKLQHGGPVDVLVKNRVKWPYEDTGLALIKSVFLITNSEWCSGFCCTMQKEHHHGIKDHIVDYMFALLDDTHDFSWQAGKARNTVLLCKMKWGKWFLGVKLTQLKE